MQMENQKRYRTFLIVLVYIIVALIGIRLGIFQEMSRGREIFHLLILALIITKICIIDSRITGKPLSIFSYWLIFILCGIAVPICIVRAHGFKGVVIIIAHYLGLMLVFILSWLVTTSLVYGTSFLFDI